MSPHKSGPRVAIIQNFKPTNPAFATDMMASFTDLIHKSAPDAIVDVINGVESAQLPNPSEYNTIILTGGMFNLALPEVEPWVERELDLIRTSAEKAPNSKLVGLCWGNQAVARALGGAVEFIPTGHVVGRNPDKLTGVGRDFFDAEELGHPEFTSLVSHRVLDADGGTFSSNMDEEEEKKTRDSFDVANDGEKTFATIMDWVLDRRQIVVSREIA
ncbi:hypothetical protein NW756_014467 [Fusarium oxysporum]|nr:hypothetical protein NW753_014336 [Fusarium oxysporum]KAJ4031394.1 hypothetical protein NW763_014758 [Fusarium oxysporum]KAJ4035496.1 hypothetical protein NW758_010530 [Fusarium oxysporum]KAJ4072895.1 hypothetical protein NW756_014467 [Fusarium oxysporum]KAJ4079649.1 hypothetical protein NW769_015076 [Fusarium oxysporum]